jgi:hypothetical protein
MVRSLLPSLRSPRRRRLFRYVSVAGAVAASVALVDVSFAIVLALDVTFFSVAIVLPPFLLNFRKQSNYTLLCPKNQEKYAHI